MSKKEEILAKCDSIIERLNRMKKVVEAGSKPSRPSADSKSAPAPAKLAKAGDLQWNENELASRLANLLPMNRRIKLQPTDEEMFGQMAITQAQADQASRDFNGKFTDFFREVQKPINQLKKFASEEEEIAYWRSIGVSKGTEDGEN